MVVYIKLFITPLKASNEVINIYNVQKVLHFGLTSICLQVLVQL